MTHDAEQTPRGGKRRLRRWLWAGALLLPVVILGLLTLSLELRARRIERLEASIGEGGLFEFGDSRLADAMEWVGLKRWADAQRPVTAIEFSAGETVDDAVFAELVRVAGPEVEAILIGSSTDSRITDRGLAALRGQRRIKLLRLGSRRITDADMPAVGELSTLVALYLDDSEVTDAGLRALRGLTDLELLSLDGTAIRGPGLAGLPNPGRLRRLSVDRTPFDDRSVATVNRFRHLIELGISDTAVTGAGLNRLDLPELIKLDAQGLDFHDANPERWRFPRLRVLVASESEVDAAAARAIAALPGLTRLELQRAEVNWTAYAELARCPVLMIIDLTGTACDDECLAELVAVRTLRELWLDDTQVTDGGVRRLVELPDLAVLSLEGIAIRAETVQRFDRAKPNLSLNAAWGDPAVTEKP